MTTFLLAIDPGSASGTCAAAMFVDEHLYQAATFSFLTRDVKHPLTRARLLGPMVRRWWSQHLPYVEPAAVAVEWPQVYQGAKQKGDPKDLLGLAAVDGAIVAMFPTARMIVYRPADWKGQVPKPKRGEKYIIESRVEAVLDAVEQIRWETLRADHGAKFHNVVDAVGIGLHALGRLHQPKTFYRGES